MKTESKYFTQGTSQPAKPLHHILMGTQKVYKLGEMKLKSLLGLCL